MADTKNKKTGFSGLDELLNDPALDQPLKTEAHPKTHEKAGGPVTSDNNKNQTNPTDAKSKIMDNSTGLQAQREIEPQKNPSAKQAQQKKSEVSKINSGNIILGVIVAFFIIMTVLDNIKKSNEDKKSSSTLDSPTTSEAALPIVDPMSRNESEAPAADLPSEYLAAPSTVSVSNWRLYDPNGNPWPQSTGYLENYPKLHTDGLSTLTIDNSQNSSDVHVKLYHLSDEGSLDVRNAFIKAGSSFTMNKIRAGMYDVRYRDLTDGGLSKSESFALEEIPVGNSIQYSMMTMTLYKIANGNMQTQSISESQF